MVSAISELKKTFEEIQENQDPFDIHQAIDLTETLINEERRQHGYLLSWLLKHYSTATDDLSHFYYYVDSERNETTINKILDHFYSETIYLD